MRQNDWNNVSSLFYEDEDDCFLQSPNNAIIEISDLLNIKSDLIIYDPLLKIFNIGNENERLEIKCLDEEIFLSRAIVFVNCCFKCEIELVNQSFSHRIVFQKCTFEENVDFTQSIFERPFEFIECAINKNLYLSYAKFQSYARFNFSESYLGYRFCLDSSYFGEDARLEGVFYCTVNLRDTTFEGNLYCSQSSAEVSFVEKTCFQGEILICNANCKGAMYLNDCEFEQLLIIDTKSKNISLDHSLIRNSNFMRSFFERGSFLNAKFLSSPSMLGCMFEQEINLTNTQFPNSFDSLVESLEYFKHEREKHIKSSLFPEYVETYSINDFFAKNRDIFRRIKHLLIKENNSLEAIDYHKAELYCRELELDFKPQKTWRDWIDWAQLFFYRHISDHHTDILRSLNSLIALIGIFGLLCGAVVWGLDYFAFDYREGINIFKLKEVYSSHIKASIEEHISDYFLGNFVLALAFVGLFLGVVWECSRKLLVPLGYGFVLIFFVTSPKYIVPAMSFFDSKRALFDPICTLGGLYTLLFGFLAYSFIKTIRKNSIIPS